MTRDFQAEGGAQMLALHWKPYSTWFSGVMLNSNFDKDEFQ